MGCVITAFGLNRRMCRSIQDEVKGVHSCQGHPKTRRGLLKGTVEFHSISREEKRQLTSGNKLSQNRPK